MILSLVCRLKLLPLLYFLCLWLCSTPAHAQHRQLWGTTYDGGLGAGVLFRYSYDTDSLQVVHAFDPFGPRRPNSGVIFDSAAQRIYGTTVSGGGNIISQGTVYSFSAQDSTFRVIYDCLHASNGQSPLALPIRSGPNRIWGTDMSGGNSSYGTIYALDLDSGRKTIRRHFSASQGTGYAAYQSPVFAHGKMYGLTHGSTSNSGTGLGVLYEFDTAANVYTVKRQFLYAMGNQPQGRLLLHPNGKLYGATTSAGANNMGTFFEYDPLIDSFVVRHHFHSPTTGGGCTGLLTLHPNGRIYGLASNGGSSGAGTLFEYDTGTKAVVKKTDLIDSIGAYPLGGLALASNGKMYAVTNRGGANGIGALIEYDLASNTVSRKQSFAGTNGSGPTWVMLQEAWTNSRPHLSAFLRQDSLCVGGSSGKAMIFAADSDGDTLQAIVRTTDPAILPASAVQLRYLGGNIYEAEYLPGAGPADTGTVSVIIRLSDAYGAAAQDSVVIQLRIRNCSTTGIGAPQHKTASLRIMPNPARNNIQVSLPAGHAAISAWAVLDASGRHVPLRAVPNAYCLELDVSALAPGSYSVIVQSNSGRQYSGVFTRQW